MYDNIIVCFSNSLHKNEERTKRKYSKRVKIKVYNYEVYYKCRLNHKVSSYVRQCYWLSLSLIPSIKMKSQKREWKVNG